MKPVICVMASAALLLFGSASYARGTPTSSFVPRGPEPHSSLSDKHHSLKGKHSGAQGSHKGANKATSKTANHATGHTPR
jgi:hypothetical protein